MKSRIIRLLGAALIAAPFAVTGVAQAQQSAQNTLAHIAYVRSTRAKIRV